MRKLSNTESELKKKTVAYKKACTRSKLLILKRHFLRSFHTLKIKINNWFSFMGSDGYKFCVFANVRFNLTGICLFSADCT